MKPLGKVRRAAPAALARLLSRQFLGEAAARVGQLLARARRRRLLARERLCGTMAQLKVLLLVALPSLTSAGSASSPPPISFTLGSVPFHSSVVPSSWVATTATFTQPGNRDRTDFTWTDNTTGMQAAVQQTAYRETDTAGAMEWLLTFRNTGATPSPPLCNVSAVDTVLSEALLGADPTVHRFVGSMASPVDYLPIVYSVPHTSAPPPPPPGPAPAPQPAGRVIHGASANQMEDGIRLWCGGKAGDDCGKGMPHGTFPCPSASACQAACAGNKTCLGATWVHPGQLGPTPNCYMLGSLDSYDPETGFSSWSKVPVPAKPPPEPTPPPATGPRFHPNAGRSSNGVLPYFAVFGQQSGVVYSVGWSGGWEAEVAFADGTSERGAAAGGVHVQVSHTTGPGTLCASLQPGESIRSMRIIAVPFTKAEALQNSVAAAPTPTSTGYMFKAGANGSVAQPTAHPSASRLADALAAEKPPPNVAPGGYNGLGFGQEGAAPGTYPQIGFNKHRRIMSRWKLPRDPRTGAVKGAMVASWAWIGWPKPQTLTQQLWHVSAVKNTTVEYYWLDAGWFNGGFPNGVGNWQLPLSACVDRAEYPNGTLAPLGTACHAAPNNVGFIVW